jgi:hypothetical protein
MSGFDGSTVRVEYLFGSNPDEFGNSPIDVAVGAGTEAIAFPELPMGWVR